MSTPNVRTDSANAQSTHNGLVDLLAYICHRSSHSVRICCSSLLQVMAQAEHMHVVSVKQVCDKNTDSALAFVTYSDNPFPVLHDPLHHFATARPRCMAATDSSNLPGTTAVHRASHTICWLIVPHLTLMLPISFVWLLLQACRCTAQ